MPLSMDEATKRYEGYIQNIQDSIFTIESCMAEQMTFQRNIPQFIANLRQLDVNKEDNDISIQIQVLQECKKIISNEKKRRSMMHEISTKKSVQDFKMQLRTKRRSDRVTVNPAEGYQNQAPQEHVME